MVNGGFMNWSDWLVIGIIGIFGIIGMMKGFIFSIFRLASFFISAALAIRFYPVISELLMGTELFEKLKSSIYNNLINRLSTQASSAAGQMGQSAAGAIVDGMELPAFLKGAMLDKTAEISKLVGIDRVLDGISSELAKMVTDMISLIILYIAIRIALNFMRVMLQGIARLPLFRQMNKLGGFAFGSLEGLFTIHVIFAVLMLFGSVPQFDGFFEAVRSSVFARYFYESNIIINWMLA